MNKKKQIAEAMWEIIGHVSEALGKAYGCFISINSEITIKPLKRKIGFKRGYKK